MSSFSLLIKYLASCTICQSCHICIRRNEKQRVSNCELCNAPSEKIESIVALVKATKKGDDCNDK